MIRIAISFTLVLSTLFVSACGTSQTATSARQGAGTGAAMGALAGLVFGDDIDDVIEGAAVGGAVGAGTGAVYGAGRENQYKQDAYVVRQAEAKRASQKQLTEQQTIALLGTDTWEGYKAARTCQSQRAIGLAQAGRASANPNHRLAAEWLVAIVAVDMRDKTTGAQQVQTIIQMDADIDTSQQASLEIDKMVLEMREERRQMGISC